LTYGASPSQAQDPMVLRRKLDLCRKFSNVLNKIDPGFSDIRAFIQRELHFSSLLLAQNDLESGKIGPQDYQREARRALAALDELEQMQRMFKF